MRQRPPSAARTVTVVLGHVVFMALFALAAQHAMLRTTFGDTAYQVFRWVNDAGWNVEAHRYSALFPQACVKLFKAGGAGLGTLLTVASLAHVLVAYIVFLVCAHVWRAERSTIGTVLAAVLCTRLTFYGPVLEANYLLSFPFLIFGALEHGGEALGRPVHMLVALLLAVLVVFAHPLGAPVLLFGLAVLALAKVVPVRPAVVLGTLIAVWMAVSRSVLPPTAYEQAQFDALRSGTTGTQGLFASASWEFLSGHTWSYTTAYLPVWVLLGATVIGLSVQRRWPIAITTLLGCAAFIGTALITFRNGAAAIMMDRAFLPLATLVALPAAVWLVSQERKAAIWRCAVLLPVLFIKLRDISFASRPFRDEAQRVDAFIADARASGRTKLALRDADLEARGLQRDWAFPCTVLLRSALDGAEGSVAAVLVDGALEPEAIRRGDLVVLREVFAPAELNTRYFGLPAGPFVPYGE